MPAYMPLGEAVGRSILNILLVIYISWGLVVIFRRGKEIWISSVCIPLLILWGAFFLSIFNAEDVPRAFHAWQKYFFSSLTVPLTVFVLRINPEKWKSFVLSLAATGVFLPFLLVAKSAISSGFEFFVLPRSMIERNLPFLLPIVFLVISRLKNIYYKLILSGFFFIFFFAIIIASQGRAALVALGLGISFYFIFVIKVRARIFVPVFSIFIVFSILISGPFFFRHAESQHIQSDYIDYFSSGRTLLWKQAIKNPPDNVFFGIGMSNVRYVDEVMTINDHRVKHLHNFLFDAWYETGLAGLAALVLLWSMMIFFCLKRIKYFNGGLRSEVLALLCSFVALLGGGLFSYSYMSPQLTNYLYFILSGLFFIGRYAIHSKTSEAMVS